MLRRGIHEAAQLDLTGKQLPFHQLSFVEAQNSGCDEGKNTRDEQHGKSVQPDNPGMRCVPVFTGLRRIYVHIYFIFGKQTKTAYA
jgi:hypothetical protein